MGRACCRVPSTVCRTCCWICWLCAWGVAAGSGAGTDATGSAVAGACALVGATDKLLICFFASNPTTASAINRLKTPKTTRISIFPKLAGVGIQTRLIHPVGQDPLIFIA